MKTNLVPIQEYIPHDPKIMQAKTILVTHQRPYSCKLLIVDVYAHDVEDNEGNWEQRYELGYLEGDSQYSCDYLKKFIEDPDYGVYIVEVSTNVKDFIKD